MAEPVFGWGIVSVYVCCLRTVTCVRSSVKAEQRWFNGWSHVCATYSRLEQGD